MMACTPLSPAEQIASELATLSVDVLATFTDSAVVLKRTLTPNGIGGSSEAWAVDPAYPTPIPVRVRQSRPTQPVVVGGILHDATDDFAIDYPDDVQLPLKERLDVAGRGTFELQAIIDTATWSFFNTAWAIRKEYA